MEENKIQQSKENSSEKEKIQVRPMTENTLPEMEDDNVATAEDLAQFIESRRKKSTNRKVVESENFSHDNPLLSDDTNIDQNNNDNNADLALEPDPTLPKQPYKESLFLTHGCSRCPQQYQPIPQSEMDSCSKVCSGNWMKGLKPPLRDRFMCVEVRFKNNRKEFFRLPDGIDVTEGDVVAVEGQPGHDVGIVSLTGEVCRLQMKKRQIDPESSTIKKLFRRAKTADIEKWAQTIQEETNALITTRKIVEKEGLVMKVNDVEFQGDRSKAIFYYTAEDRVDFRNLIKVLAEQFHVRVEMKQIGVRQEAGKVGGIGTCGRELCCSTWLTDFQSVTTGVAKAQQILPNPQKLAGQCGKLKCCLNFEYEVYVDAAKKLPPHTPIRFQKGLAVCKKTDILRGLMWYAYEGENDMYALPADKVREIMDMNLAQQYPEKIEDYQVELMSTAALTQEGATDDFEQELRRMADTTDDNVKTTDSPRKDEDSRSSKGNRNRHDRKENDDHRRDNRNENRRNDNHNRRHNDNPHPENGTGNRPETATPHPREENENRKEEMRHRRRDNNRRRDDNRPQRNNNTTNNDK